MAEQSRSTTRTTGRDLVIERVFDAPRELVWKAWTDPEWMMRWWGPKDFTSPVAKIDLRVSGQYLFCMQSPDYQDGRKLWSTGTYKEIVPPERLVYTDSFADEQGNRVAASEYGMEGDWPEEQLVTVTLEDLGGKTKMTLRHEGFPEGEVEEMAGSGWSESLDKLAGVLAEEAR